MPDMVQGKEHVIQMTGEQVREEIECLRRMFPIVRLLDEKTLQEMPCYAPWKDEKPCRNCIGREVLRSKGRKSKLEYVGAHIYQATARYLEVDGRPCVMEIIQPLETEEKVIAEEGEKLYHDALTGAYNRRYYEDHLRRQYMTAGVAVIDLDDFKLYNDTFGHHAGDVVLETAVATIQRCIRDTDYLVRYGGDELLLILPDIAGDDFTRKLRLINSKIHGAVIPGYQKLHMSASIGGVLSAGMTVEKAVREADKLMYQAKMKKNFVVTDHDGEEEEEPAAEQEKPLIMIVDDSEMNRLILSEMLREDYRILEAESGEECLRLLEKNGTEISLILLDIVMPGMNGLEVLSDMSRQNWLESIPVIMISSEDSNVIVRRSYELGASDYISRPFDARVVYQRVSNTIRLYAKQRRLSALVSQQFYEREKNNRMMINILSQVVELRNGESGLHVQHIQILTEILLDRVVQKTDHYHLSRSERSLIATASALHDIGKIAIDDAILNKPGRLTKEEFEIMKTHTMIGARMLEELVQYKDEPLVQTAYQICRWHHERYDGKGYPDGLVGEEIPFAAQVVSLADVYDALTSERVYKKAIPHEEAIQMILRGECGAFNPMLINCLLDVQDKIQMELNTLTSTPPQEDLSGAGCKNEETGNEVKTDDNSGSIRENGRGL